MTTSGPLRTRALLFEAEDSDLLFLLVPLVMTPGREDLKRHRQAEWRIDAGLFSAVSSAVSRDEFHMANQGSPPRPERDALSGQGHKADPWADRGATCAFP